MEHLSKSPICCDRVVPDNPVLPVRQCGRLWLLADFHRNPDQLCLLFPRGALGKRKTDGRNADDAKDAGVCVDDLYGAGIDWMVKFLLNIV